MESYKYDDKSFSFIASPGKSSEFDVGFQRIWNEKITEGYFRYDLSGLKSKEVWEHMRRYVFVAQLNVKRATERRSAQNMTDVVMKFDPSNFHFNKIDKKEVIYDIIPMHWRVDEHGQETIDNLKHALIINASPIEYCSSLLVPFIERELPQKMTLEGLKLAVEIMLSSHDRDLRIAYNSPGGYASVNNFHFHVYYLRHRLTIEDAPLKVLEGKCFEFEKYPAVGFVFQIEDAKEINGTIRLVMHIIDFLIRRKIAHNVFITRGKSYEHQDSEDYTAIRIIIWARKNRFGAKTDRCLTVAVCELAGHIIFKDEDEYDAAVACDIMKPIIEECQEVFEAVKRDVKNLLRSL